ncbi:HdeD family acid-resistance protein [Rahnella sp. ChDrAdgB13]|uniref:HdeD family acid-resistance protein n=1 Tax=Rahnella sp. ChDrAdgB13 TaxID=1850581 RepID=UPI001AD89B36|nr:MFS transporter [Rahnella sp. ChDrAdgB13]
MLQIALLLTGSDFVRRNSPILFLASLLWSFAGAAVLADGMMEASYFPFHVFGYFLLAESMLTLLTASGTQGARRSIFCFKGGIIGFVAILILSGRHSSNLMMAIIFGFACFMTGLFVVTSAWVVRYPHWRRALCGGIFQLIFALFLFLPYPAKHDGTVPQLIGMLMLTSGIQCALLAFRLRHLRDGYRIFDMFTPDDLLGTDVQAEESNAVATAQPGQQLTVHVWTPEGSSATTPVSRPVLNRYIAAVDARGVISTGHAALEMGPDIYISLYPAVDIDRSPAEFFNTLRAVRDNNVAGEFKEGYTSEAAAWCESDRKIVFHDFSPASLTHFWTQYRQQEIYNLTWRNCSSSVAYALEAALDGVRGGHGGWIHFLRLFLIPELWIAAQLRKRATTMAWTPGLLLDYSRALHALVHPVRLTWFSRRYRQKDTSSDR